MRIPSAFDIELIVAAFDRHPLGTVLFLLMLVIIVAGIGVYRWAPKAGTRTPTIRSKRE